MKKQVIFLILALTLLFAFCNLATASSTSENETFLNKTENNTKSNIDAVGSGTVYYVLDTFYDDMITPQGSGYDIGAYEKTTNLLQPSDLVYMGAFRLPDTPGSMGWEWAGVEMGALTYYPQGDSEGPSDGFPGSLYGTGHDQLKYISEINIPLPIISPDKNPADLNTAVTIQDFENVLGDRLDGMELPKVGLAYLTKQGNQTLDKLYYCFGQHIQDEQRNPSHGWFELDLSNSQLAGDWKIDNLLNYLTTYYIFSISKEWADINTPGKYLVTGRYRDGGQGSQGPTLFAYGPWNEGNPPLPGTELSYVSLLQYSSVTDPEIHVMNNYAHSDEWNGGAWLTSGDKSAVIFTGTKGIGNTWYGFSDGTEWPTSGEGPFPPVPIINPTFYGEDLRGWWSDSFQAQILFYDPSDLAAVSQGTMEPYEPQPYAVLNIDPYLFNLKDSQQKDRVGAVAFDSARGILYVSEPLADGDKTIIHVWKLKSLNDYTPPVLVTTDPENNVVNVARDKVIQVTFSEPIKAGNMWIELYTDSTHIPINKSINGSVLTVNHSALLGAGTRYTLCLHTGSVLDLAGNPLALVGRVFTTSTDAVGPVMLSSDPVINTMNVARDKVIRVTFSEPVRVGNNWVELISSGGVVVPITTSIIGNVLSVSHSALLAASTRHTLCLHTGSVVDLAGNPLALLSRAFTTTTDTLAPSISSTDPLNNAVNVARDKVIKVTFSEPIKVGSLWIELYNGSTQIPINLSINGNILTITHTALLAANTKYTLCLHTGSILDLAGNLLALDGRIFTTSTDTVAPVMISSDPVINSVNVPQDKVIQVTFSEPIKTGNLWIELYNGSTQIPINMSISGNNLTITHNTLLAANTKYTLCLHTGSITDLAGNPLALFTRVFTTGNT